MTEQENPLSEIRRKTIVASLLMAHSYSEQLFAEMSEDDLLKTIEIDSTAREVEIWAVVFIQLTQIVRNHDIQLKPSDVSIDFDIDRITDEHRLWREKFFDSAVPLTVEFIRQTGPIFFPNTPSEEIEEQFVNAAGIDNKLIDTTSPETPIKLKLSVGETKTLSESCLYKLFETIKTGQEEQKPEEKRLAQTAAIYLAKSFTRIVTTLRDSGLTIDSRLLGFFQETINIMTYRPADDQGE